MLGVIDDLSNEPGLKDPKEETQWNHFCPCLQKAKAHHCDTPEESYGWQERARAELSQDDRRRRL